MLAPKRLARLVTESKSSASTAKKLVIVLVTVLLPGSTSSLAVTASKSFVSLCSKVLHLANGTLYL